MPGRKRPRVDDVESLNSSISTRSPSVSPRNAESDCSSQNVRVVARVRPLSTKEINERSQESIKALEASNIISVDNSNNRKFEYDAVFGTESTQAQVYEKTAGDMIRNNVFKGFNVTILAYGQTGSGKTFTMGTEGWSIEKVNEREEKNKSSDHNNEHDLLSAPPSDGHGIIPRAVHDVFLSRQKIENGEERVKIQMSYLEIYNEEAKDLLSNGSSDLLQIRDSKADGVVVQNLSCHEVKSPKEVSDLIKSASQKRAVGATAMNAVSSRSHAICTLYISIAPLLKDENQNDEKDMDADDDESGGDGFISAKLTLVDLAGSERIKRTHAEGARLKEGININKGLFVLGQVVSTLSELGQQQGNSSSNNHIPYRDSKLTRLLQDSLGGNSKTIMVACVSPADSNVEESINTLRYAQRTRNIKNSAIRNVAVAAVSPVEVARLRKENQMLKLQLLQLKSEDKYKTIQMDSTGQTGESKVIMNGHIHDNNCGNNNINGMDVGGLSRLTQLNAGYSSLNAQIEKLQTQVEVLRQDYLEASLKSDKWQYKYEQIVKDRDGKQDDEGLDLVSELRNQIICLQQEKEAAETDAAISRATAAAIVTKGGDLEAAEDVMLAEGGSIFDLDKDDKNDKEEEEKLTHELILMNGNIDQKEAMMIQMERENATLLALRSHFECAIGTLQEEVDVLTNEREELLNKVTNSENKTKGTSDSNDGPSKQLRNRINELEKKIQELKGKAAEHARSLRLRNQAERKLQELKSDLLKDKKLRADLQRKLKEEGKERRAEKKAARLQASRMLRDSQKMKLELQKVKDAAAKQAAVFRRKAAEAVSKQKTAMEQQKKRSNALLMRSGSFLNKNEISKDRKGEILGWLDREIDISETITELKKNIEEHTNLIEDIESKKIQFISNKENVKDNSFHAASRAIDVEIEQRNAIIHSLEKNIEEVLKANSVKGGLQSNSSQSGPFTDTSFWQAISRIELRFLIYYFFDKILTMKQDMRDLKANQNQLLSDSIADERRRNNQMITAMKIGHSEEITALLESTKYAMESQIRKELFSDDSPHFDEATQHVIEQYLQSYFATHNQVNESVKRDLHSIKVEHNLMKNIVDEVAVNLITQNEAAAIVKRNKKKRSSKPLTEDEVFFEEEDQHDVIIEDPDDSDWSPDSPVRRRPRNKSKSTDLSVQELNENKKQVIGEQVSQELGKNFAKMKVAHLKELCRARGLPLGGRKAELIERLQNDSKLTMSNEKSLNKSSSESQSTPDVGINKLDKNNLLEKHETHTSKKRRLSRSIDENEKIELLNASRSLSNVVEIDKPVPLREKGTPMNKKRRFSRQLYIASTSKVNPTEDTMSSSMIIPKPQELKIDVDSKFEIGVSSQALSPKNRRRTSIRNMPSSLVINRRKSRRVTLSERRQSMITKRDIDLYSGPTNPNERKSILSKRDSDSSSGSNRNDKKRKSMVTKRDSDSSSGSNPKNNEDTTSSTRKQPSDNLKTGRTQRKKSLSRHSVRSPLKPIQKTSDRDRKRRQRNMEASVNKAFLQLESLSEFTA